jgi:hypothetical protein
VARRTGGRAAAAHGHRRSPATDAEELAEVGARRPGCSPRWPTEDATRPPEAILAELLDTGADGGIPWLTRALGGDRR